MRFPTLVLLALAAGHVAVPPACAQGPDTSRVRAGVHYGAGGLHRLFFGRDYRDLWTAELAVPVMDLGSFAGGLTPTTAGGGLQTKSLRFRGADGYAYGFRSVDKDPGDVLPKEFAGTFVEDLVRDQTSSQHPGGPAVVAPLAEAAGLLHTDPRLVVLPDDPRLGQFRERFRGTLGFIERRATIEPGRPPFAGALEIIESDELLERTERDPNDRLNTRAYLLARLFDFWIGDWDRHRGQWTWARRTDGPLREWVVIPEDRDQAFARYDGALLGVARLTAPFLLDFGDAFGSIVGATWNGRDLDRRYLTPLPPEVWDSAAAALQSRLTDAVIDDAVRRLPPELYRLDGERLARALKARRDALPAFARRVHALLSREADVHGTNAAEDVTIDRNADGSVDVRIVPRQPAGPVYVARRFTPGVTHDIRVYLHQGEDRVLLRGPGRGIPIRLIGGGSATVVDSSRATGVRLYATGGDQVAGPGPTSVDRRAEVAPPPLAPYLPWRDWGGQWMPSWWFAFGPDVGFFLGASITGVNYGFRKYPFATQVRLRGGYAFEAQRPRVTLDILSHHENSRVRTDFQARFSGIEIVKYHGLGNETVATGPAEFYRVRQEQYRLAPMVHVPIGPVVALSFTALGEWIKTRADSGRIIVATQPVGAGEWAQVGGSATLTVDTRDLASYPTRGIMLRLAGQVYPPVLDVDSVYGLVEGELATYLTARAVPLRPTLALRAGGKQVWGRYPFFAAAFLGDAATARLGRQNRYGGDAAVWGNAELRLRLTRYFFVLPGELGLFGLADVGRVFLAGETSDRWHSAFGGGLWFSILRPTTVLSVALARTPERTGVYLGTGMSF